MDLPGFGGSPALSPPLQPTPAALAAAAIAIDQAGVHDPDVVGNSIGGWVALGSDPVPGGAQTVCLPARCTASTAAQRTKRLDCWVIRPRCTVASDSVLGGQARE